MVESIARVFTPSRHRPSGWWRLIPVLLGSWLAVSVAAISARGAIPESPQSGVDIHDLGNLIMEADAQVIRELQQHILSQTGVPIVVVTIKATSDYDPGSIQVGELAQQWFAAWELGGEEQKGILMLVSPEESLPHIELGSAWGKRPNWFIENWMNSEVKQKFERGTYSAGILAALRGMLKVAQVGPEGQMPQGASGDKDYSVKLLENMLNKLLENALVKWSLLVVGAAFLIRGIVSLRLRKTCLLFGAVTIGAATLGIAMAGTLGFVLLGLYGLYWAGLNSTGTGGFE